MTQPDRLQGLFRAELEELTAALARGLAELGQEVSRAALDELFRAAHSLKGAAQVMGARQVADVAHGLESVLSALREQTIELDESIRIGLVEATDWLQGVPSLMAAGGTPDGREARELRRRLAELVVPPDAHEAARAASEDAVGAAPDGPEPVRNRVHRERDSVRIDVSKLDELLEQTSEIMVASRRLDVLQRQLNVATTSLADHDAHWRDLRGLLSEAERHGVLAGEITAAVRRADASWGATATAADPLARQAVAVKRDLRQSVGPLADSVLQLRTISFAQVCEGLDRLVREVARRSGNKQAVLTIEGEGVELDRSVALAVREPLIHLVNNAVDHGIESVEQRGLAGKPKVGRVRLAAELRGGQIEIVVADDGAGLDPEAIRAAARGAGLQPLEEQSDFVEAVFTSGLTTATVVTESSGRGVGLDAVRARVDAMGGRVDLVSNRNHGATVTIVVPLTLSVLHAVTARVADQTVMLPSAGIQRVLHVDPSTINMVAGRATILLDGRHVPVVDLAQVLGWAAEPPTPAETIPGVVVAAGGTEVVLGVSALMGEGEVTVHSLGERIGEAPGTIGATLLPDGGVALILSAMACARLAWESVPTRGRSSLEPVSDPATLPRVLLVEDTLTTRVLEQGILESAGYEVTTAVDGADAWQQLRDTEFDLVISDVNMPRMDGLQLCAAIRRSRRYSDLPIVLVTSLADEADRRRGVEAGANAYIVKSGFDRGVLLDTVARLLA